MQRDLKNSDLKNRSAFGSAAVVSVAGFCFLLLSAGLGASGASAQNSGAAKSSVANANAGESPAAGPQPQKPTPTARTTQATTGPKKKPQQTANQASGAGARYYFIEFRSRLAESYGHAYITFGRVDAKGKIIQSEVAGLHPATESVLPWLIGHIIPVPSETGASDGDLEEIYVSARYRVPLSEADYTRTVAFIKKLQASNPLWHASLNNCIGFLKDVAKFMGLRTPLSTVVYPEVFVNNLREMNESPDHSAKTLLPRMQWGIQ
jgi:hypothetical protein